MTSEFYTYVLSIASGVIILLLGVLSFFVSRLVTDIRQNTMDIGKNKGNIELLRQEQRSDIKRIEERTQLEISMLSKNVSELSSNVKVLITELSKKGINNID